MTAVPKRAVIFEEIDAERKRQTELWGSQWEPGSIPEVMKLAILTEEVGEVAKDILEGRKPRKELVQAASVIVAWLESLPEDRQDDRQHHVGGAETDDHES